MVERATARRLRGPRVPAIAIALALSLGACETSAPELGAASGAPRPAGGAIEPLGDAEFAALAPDERYRVANKLLGTLYDGLPVPAFYDLSPGAGLREAAVGGEDVSPPALRARLAAPLPAEERARLDRAIVGDEGAVDANGAPAPLEPAYRFDDRRPAQMPLARLVEYPTSRDRYSQWMAWHLANTILFSPAEEIDSADMTDVQNVLRRLDLAILSNVPIRDVVAVHQRSVENWRRFRSPEDNTREMMEIYLGLFDRDDLVPLASQACRDLYLTDERDGYKLARTDFPNVEPVLVLDVWVTSCEDFYDAVAGHPLLIPRVAGVLVDHFFSGESAERRLELTAALAATNPRTFEDLFTAILFSRAYLLEVERPRGFEENFLALAARLGWEAHPEVLKGMIGGRGPYARAEMAEMGWPALSAKLGRTAEVPLDSLSFANHHKALRESLLLDVGRWQHGLALKRPDAPSPAAPVPLEPGADAKAVAAFEMASAEHATELAALSEAERAAWNEAQDEYLERRAAWSRIDDLTSRELLDYLFLTVAQRRPVEDEYRDLHAVAFAEGLLDAELANRFVRSGRQQDFARIAFDYLSRLPETYYLPRVR